MSPMGPTRDQRRFRYRSLLGAGSHTRADVIQQFRIDLAFQAVVRARRKALSIGGELLWIALSHHNWIPYVAAHSWTMTLQTG